MAKAESLDAHEKPPTYLKNVYKYYHKLSTDAINSDLQILDFARGSAPANAADGTPVVECGKISSSVIVNSCCTLGNSSKPDTISSDEDVVIYEAKDIPGLRLVPSLIPNKSQKDLLSVLLHRDLADPQYRTNVHMHHRVPYDAIPRKVSISSDGNHGSFQLSFFNGTSEACELFLPIDSEVHKPFTISQFLKRKLRWLTLGGQYDWTKKCYPSENPPFPADIAAFTQGLFPDMKAEAAIVNIYTPGDTLSMHRDVSEDTNKGLVSISLGCDGIFVIGLGSDVDEKPNFVVARLRSGDAVFMSGSARFAWHGVPRILPNTCPPQLRSWPAEDKIGLASDATHCRYESWRDWMSNKRINLNIRQMRD